MYVCALEVYGDAACCRPVTEDRILAHFKIRGAVEPHIAP